ncbi:hypothetical protein ACFWDA_18125 [Rhodococcus zopfii]|uniref:hypothetical protein n=1 Tax=Rhodococcus zopfii TaxID=43772 RepID=UPI000A7D760D|nr:hypothetical protein [Rhodococcus zopfii]
MCLPEWGRARIEAQYSAGMRRPDDRIDGKDAHAPNLATMLCADMEVEPIRNREVKSTIAS